MFAVDFESGDLAVGVNLLEVPLWARGGEVDLDRLLGMLSFLKGDGAAGGEGAVSRGVEGDVLAGHFFCCLCFSWLVG